MNKILSILVLTFFSFNAFSAKTFTRCSNGTIEEVGDSLFTANFFENRVELQIYEGSFSLDVDQVNWKDNTTIVMDAEATYYVEGTVEQITVDLLVLMSADGNSAKVAYGINKESFTDLDLTCKEVSNY